MKKIYLLTVQILMVLILLFTVGCEREGWDVVNDEDDDDDGDDPTEIFKVGQEYKGGIIAYVDYSGKHGLIAAPTDQSAGIQWYNGSFFVTDANGTSMGEGKNNTKRIVQMQGNGNYAAKICDNLVLKGYDDWYLPSKDELNKLYQNRVEIGGFDYTGSYWSSSEYSGSAYYYSSSNSAYFQYFNNGNQSYFYKDNICRVRAIRSF
jgi:hypothetical protein